GRLLVELPLHVAVPLRLRRSAAGGERDEKERGLHAAEVSSPCRGPRRNGEGSGLASARSGMKSDEGNRPAPARLAMKSNGGSRRAPAPPGKLVRSPTTTGRGPSRPRAPS